MPTLTFPKRHKHADVRSREYLTAAEVERLRKAARSIGRHGLRNDTMILLVYRHGLRVAELITLRWDQLDLDQGFLHVRRVKRGVDQRGHSRRKLRFRLSMCLNQKTKSVMG